MLSQTKLNIHNFDSFDNLTVYITESKSTTTKKQSTRKKNSECEASVKSVAPGSPTGGEAQWKGIQERKDAASSADDAKFAKNMDNSGRGGTSTL